MCHVRPMGSPSSSPLASGYCECCRRQGIPYQQLWIEHKDGVPNEFYWVCADCGGHVTEFFSPRDPGGLCEEASRRAAGGAPKAHEITLQRIQCAERV